MVVIYDLQHDGTFHRLVSCRLRCHDLRLFDHSERLRFSLIKLCEWLIAGDSLLLLLAEKKINT